MALISLGKNAALFHSTRDLQAMDEPNSTAEQDKLDKVRGDIRTALAPWIPGDYLATYGTLLTAWSGLRGHFWPMIAIAVGSAFIFVFIGAISVSGLAAPFVDPQLRKPLLVRAAVGAVASVIVSSTIPTSGWYAWVFFNNNESSILVTLGIFVPLLAGVLTAAKVPGSAA